MELVYTKIDPKTATKEEIQNEINRLQQLANDKKNEEQAIKIFINSIYGALASIWFVGYNTKIAESVTLQGQDMIKYTIKILNRYFLEFWHKDKKLHKKLGIKQKVNKVLNNVVIYGDTDSTYITFGEVLKSCNWKEEPIEFINKIYEYRLKEYLEKAFEKYAEKYNTENLQVLELEKISKSSIILAKKKYVLDLVWKDPGIYYKPQSKIISKGVEIVQSSTPNFARKKLNELLKYIFKEGKNLNMKEFVKKLTKIKDEFKYSNIEEISKTTSITNYQKYISQDQKKLVIQSSCPIHVRAAGVYNFLLNNSKFKRKYQLIKAGDKIRWYFAKDNNKINQDVFAYQPGSFPYEFAPDVDYDKQFSKTIIEPLNRFITAIGFNSIPSNLITTMSLF